MTAGGGTKDHMGGAANLFQGTPGVDQSEQRASESGRGISIPGPHINL